MKFLLEIKAELQNIMKMTPMNGVDDYNMPYFFKLRCERCDIVTKEQCLYMNEYVQHKRHVFNHVVKRKGCKRVGTVDFISSYGTEYTAATSNTYVSLMMFECDGMIPEDYAFNGGWKLQIGPDNYIEGVSLLRREFVDDQQSYGLFPPVVKDINGIFTVQ